MIKLDKGVLNTKYDEVVRDIQNKDLTSSSWIWIGLGAVSGFLLSCLRFNKRSTKPILVSKKLKEEDLGILSRKWNSKNNKGC